MEVGQGVIGAGGKPKQAVEERGFVEIERDKRFKAASSQCAEDREITGRTGIGTRRRDANRGGGGKRLFRSPGRAKWAATSLWTKIAHWSIGQQIGASDQYQAQREPGTLSWGPAPSEALLCRRQGAGRTTRTRRLPQTTRPFV